MQGQGRLRYRRLQATGSVSRLTNRKGRSDQRFGSCAGVGSLYGVNISGFFAWWIWCTIYLSKLPRLEKKLRVALDWTLDLLFSKDLCQFIDVRQEHRMSKDILRNLQGAGRGVSPP